MFEITKYLYVFALFSSMGWILEFCYRSISKGKIINPGFLRGPYLPIYGVSAVALTFCIDIFQGDSLLLRAAVFGPLSLPAIIMLSNPISAKIIALFSKAILYFLLATGIELTTGLIFGGLLKRPLWDYSREAFCIRNSICLRYSCYWVLLSFFFEYALLPPALFVGRSLPPFLVLTVTLAVCFIISMDFLHQFVAGARVIEERRAARKERDHREFKEIVQPLLDTAEVRHLADFKHHWSTNRLEHSLEVAWHSYVITKRLSLDYTSAARGSLLHDLFFYDWLKEGPRLHGYRHPLISLQNAQRITHLNDREKDIIQKHMWPLTLIPPRYPEAWSTCFVDTYCGAKDYVVGVKNSWRRVGEG